MPRANKEKFQWKPEEPSILQGRNEKNTHNAGFCAGVCHIYIALVCNFFVLLGNPIGNERMVSIATRILLLSCLAGLLFVLMREEGTADQLRQGTGTMSQTTVLRQWNRWK